MEEKVTVDVMVSRFETVLSFYQEEINRMKSRALKENKEVDIEEFNVLCEMLKKDVNFIQEGKQ